MAEPMHAVGSWTPRPTRCTGTVDAGRSRLKFYEISATGKPIPAPIIEAAHAAAGQVLARDSEPCCGYVICHAGMDATWLIVDRWNQDMLHHTLLRADQGDAEFQPAAREGPSYCVWELEVIDHERRAWIRHGLAETDTTAYLNQALHIEGWGA